MRRRPARTLTATVLLALALLAAACSSDGGGTADGTTTTAGGSTGGPGADTTTPGTDDPVADGIRIEVLSSQPDRVTGDDARVRITPAASGTVGELRATLDGADVTGQFQRRDDGLEGVLHGLVEGTNSLTVTGGSDTATLRLRAWPRQGPMISGPQTPLPACSTEEHGLGTATDDQCSAPPRVTWRYLSTANQLVSWDNPDGPLPADVARAEVDGHEVPLLIRYEQGVVNRSVYEVAAVAPQPGDGTPATVPAVWNRRLVYRYGSGCGATYGQGTATVTALDPELLRAGYAVATATFNSGAVQCNDVVSAETTKMVKERFIEEFGAPDFTIGDGTGFGGAMVHQILQNYPGVLDGATTTDAFPDITVMANEVADCVLLDRYFAGPSGRTLSPEARTAITGHVSATTCEALVRDYGTLFDPSTGCDPKVPADRIYDPTRQPNGIRCTLADINRVPFGTDPGTGQAYRPVDNTGVQYGLQALNDDKITMDQFLDLNEKIGGLDADGRPQDDRTSADPAGVQGFYETGRVSEGTGDQGKVPLIDIVKTDDPARGEPGDLHRALALRQRIERTVGAAGQQIWLVPAGSTAPRAGAVAAVDAWLTALGGDRSGDNLSGKEPDAARARCTLPDGTAVLHADAFDDGGPCLASYPGLADPKMVAGGPAAGDVITCELKPVTPQDYARLLDRAAITRLERLFASGVCDWEQAGAGQSYPSMTDRTYEDADDPAGRA